MSGENTLAAYQREVDEWIRTVGVRYFSELTNTAVLMEEVGELTRALRRDQRDELEGEFADVFAWLSTLASIAKIDLEEAVRNKYEGGCPRCEATPCACG